jgi:glycolate oxidase FAD binding subunit
MQLAGERRSGPVGPADLDGVTPRELVEPASAEEVAAVLASASRERRSVVMRGGGTKLGWGRKPSAIDVILSTKATQ